jgi:hypothetical protein
MAGCANFLNENFLDEELVAFPLIFRGRLKSCQAKGLCAEDKQFIRGKFHPQIRNQFLNLRPPLPELVKAGTNFDVYQKGKNNRAWCLHRVGNFLFRPLVIRDSEVQLIAELDIQMLWRGQPGNIVRRTDKKFDGIDIDNRLKVLLDALAMPQENQVTELKPSPDENPMYCLMQDDNMITKLSVSTARLTVPPDTEESKSPEYVEVTVNVAVKYAYGLVDSEF